MSPRSCMLDEGVHVRLIVDGAKGCAQFLQRIRSEGGEHESPPGFNMRAASLIARSASQPLQGGLETMASTLALANGNVRRHCMPTPVAAAFEKPVGPRPFHGLARVGEHRKGQIDADYMRRWKAC